jgi:hypothetical protein
MQKRPTWQLPHQYPNSQQLSFHFEDATLNYSHIRILLTFVHVCGCVGVCVCVREREREPYLEKVAHKGISSHTFNEISLQKEQKKMKW